MEETKKLKNVWECRRGTLVIWNCMLILGVKTPRGTFETKFEDQNLSKSGDFWIIELRATLCYLHIVIYRYMKQYDDKFDSYLYRPSLRGPNDLQLKSLIWCWKPFFKSYKIKPQNIQFEEAMVRFHNLNPLAYPHLGSPSIGEHCDIVMLIWFETILTTSFYQIVQIEVTKNLTCIANLS